MRIVASAITLPVSRMATETVQLFLNPTAGRGRAGRRQKRIVEILRSGDADVRLHASRAVGDLEARVRKCVQDGANRIVVAGGDGSVHEAVNGIMAAGGDALLGVIPSGTGNDFAKACDIPLNWQHAAQLLADRMAAEQHSKSIDIGIMNGRYFANGAGIGFDADVTRIARSYHLPIGDLVYLLAIFHAMRRGIPTPRMTISSPQFSWYGPATLASVSNGPWIGGMFHIAPAAVNDDGRLELMVAGPLTRRRILSLLPKLMSGKHMDEPEIRHHGAAELTIAVSEPLTSHLDGEIQPPQDRFELSLLPEALRLL